MKTTITTLLCVAACASLLTLAEDPIEVLAALVLLLVPVGDKLADRINNEL